MQNTKNRIYVLFNVFTDDVKGVVGEGMPIHKNPYEKGNLYIKFELEFPDNLFGDEAKLKVSSLLHNVNKVINERQFTP